MKKLKDVIEKVGEYSEKYRAESLEKFEISGVYDLFPESIGSNGWPSEWPNNGKYGVYLIMDKDENVIYIGESKNIGKRLSNYFQYSKDNSCKIMHKWSVMPKYVCTIAINSKTWFERLALEEFLIYYAQPVDNKKGK
ncbi:GIY-YIG catalytic domain-containing protein [Lutibacter oricola]|uniref:GIY-YIG catalytic domain-containing protein n=1 Tax=Lutibacter oricola TaxID=762486 RepID=A0A1H3CLY2_9FLAO|nr:GIY-YIG nuclease family protein [Lutibacter oricola]SDX55163.1 GIY-YIG catalytic domain-containing protein [Lutibacter oricola]